MELHVSCITKLPLCLKKCEEYVVKLLGGKEIEEQIEAGKVK